MKKEMIFGIDEAGRGPLAGPVAVSIFGLKKGFTLKNFPQGKDSKKMTEKEREYWFDIFQKEKIKGNIYYSIYFSTARSIDAKGIMHSIRNAMKRGLKEMDKNAHLDEYSKILLDGALYAPKEFVNQRTIIKGDEKKKVIACASIVAKVMRDRLMKRFSKKYPVYRFEINKGYGTVAHRKSILMNGPCDIHRKSYIK